MKLEFELEMEQLEPSGLYRMRCPLCPADEGLIIARTQCGTENAMIQHLNEKHHEPRIGTA